MATLHASSIYLASAEDLKGDFAFEGSGGLLAEGGVCLYRYRYRYIYIYLYLCVLYRRSNRVLLK